MRVLSLVALPIQFISIYINDGTASRIRQLAQLWEKVRRQQPPLSKLPDHNICRSSVQASTKAGGVQQGEAARQRLGNDVLAPLAVGSIDRLYRALGRQFPLRANLGCSS